ncbi:S-methyl-5'-thioadenosine phosphorylase [Actinacidiphila bryophytorum]|uniref:Purine nucleoside phosphorylase n=1 Tax=Actinacidiphila bryophytorum TaxID=1436133 RepID=A0A9W4MGB3_9ACTN|nr:S-methyl-5'-thioadenosine phosphorylase [Actinacidiphila bryophytorum]MBM9438778.1 S-methyl-5'-thioadenosine phosphorylase [Actinacidiphila bryophytorum]MBN6541866.1 S-methyl-5'-thioadenosine phosphorylase [Actinacidiphila bryophytorum]CAG7638195.1 Purine nucleoside phosphorylase [Actinacidiphila bryophytorum]
MVHSSDVTQERAEIGVIGGSGFYSFLDDVTEVTVDTPYGPASDSLFIGGVAGRRVAFLPRHGRDHRLPPHKINYRANLWALRSVGVRQVLGPCAVGGLRAQYGPGTLLVPDQLVDRTKSRAQSYFDGEARADGEVPNVVHVTFADPYCPVGRKAAVSTARASGWDAVDGGTLVVVEGPRFSTRAESLWHAAQGWSVVGMTGHPEAVLARELGLCYTSLTLVTDLDAGADTGDGVGHEEVLEVFAANVGRMRDVLFELIGALPGNDERKCLCLDPLGGQDPGITLP